MGTLSHVLHTGARPICVTEFADALRAISPPRFPAAQRLPPNRNPSRGVEVAVSGGVDSMALAYLCTRLRRYDPNFQIADNPVRNFHAVVVDHRLRDGSTNEARAVAAAVRNIGMPSDVMPIRWPRSGKELGEYEHITHLPNIESLARTFRYRKLGSACNDRFSVSLLLAHHEDDQYETVLMRLLQGHGRRGLRGIQAAADIPECEGLYGARQSGFIDDQQRLRPFYPVKPMREDFSRLRWEMASSIDRQTLDQERRQSVVVDGADFHNFEHPNQPERDGPLNLVGRGIHVEDGGIMMYRPLLEFSKDRLIATCEVNGIPWWEDSTNKDPTLTMRNSVRHMCKNFTLPVALQKPSILALSRRCEQEARAREAEANRLLSETIIHDVQPMAGSASVQFPDYNLSRFSRDQFHPVRRRARILRQREIAGLLIRRIMEIVAPEERTIPLANLQNVITWLFPALSNSTMGQTVAELPKAFAATGIHFIPMSTSSSSSFSSPSHQSTLPQRADRPLVWYLTRAPYPSHQPIPRLRIPFWSLPHYSSYNPADSKWWKRKIPWNLWDGRFWIHVQHRLPYRVIVRPFQLSHAKAFRESLTPEDRARLETLLKLYAPAKARFTLPALYLEEPLDLANPKPRRYYPVSPATIAAWYPAGANADAPDPTSEHPTTLDVSKLQLIALPSLDVQVPHLEKWLKYKIRYRRIDRSTLETAGSSKYSSFVSSRSLRTGPAAAAAAAAALEFRRIVKRRKGKPVRAYRQRGIDRRGRNK